MNIFNIITRNYIHKYIHLEALKKNNKLKRKARDSFSTTLISTRATRDNMAGHALDNPALHHSLASLFFTLISVPGFHMTAECRKVLQQGPY